MNEPLQRPEYSGADAIKGEPPATPPTTIEQPLAYKPVSGWAIAGCAVGGSFALLVAICTIVALSQGAPLFFPMWILGLAGAGVILSWIGQRQVQNSDGTRAGGKLAAIGMWLSLISGLGYFSYSYVTGLALENQANAFLMDKLDDDTGFFPRLREGVENPVEMNRAFLLTRPATDRGRARPDDQKAMKLAYDIPRDGPAGDLSNFREYPFARLLFKESAKSAEVTPLAVQEWNYEQRRYKVIRNYRIKTREGEFEYRMTVTSTEAEAPGQGRKWFLNLKETVQIAKRLSDFGKGLGRLRPHARAKLYEWAFKPNQGALNDIANKDQTAWDRLAPDAAGPAQFKTAIYAMLAGAERLPQFQVLGRDDEFGKWEEVGGKVHFYETVRFLLPRPGAPPVNVDMQIVVEPAVAVDPATFGEYTDPPDWRLVSVAVTMIAPATEKKRGL